MRFYIRNNSERQRKTYSDSVTGADGWTTPVFDENLVEPICMMGGLNAGDFILLTVPDPQAWDFRYGKNYGKRHNLTCYLSADEGVSWAKP